MYRFFFPVFNLFVLFCLSNVSATAQTVLYPGDLAVVGLASNVGGDSGDCLADTSSSFQGRDRVSFVAFKAIQTGTVLDITDNGWERENAGRWGNTEGFIRVTRTGALIPAGTVITFEFPVSETNYEAKSPDAEWNFEILGTNALNFNDGGDQLYFLQGGSWNNGATIGCCNGEQDATYSGGRILFGFNSLMTWDQFANDSQHSGLHPDVIPCFNMAPTSGIAKFSSYSGPLFGATQLEWIGRIANPGNWMAFDSCEVYQDPPATFPLEPSGMLLSCKVCTSCEPFLDTLTVSLPENGGPFTIAYTNGLDTFQLEDVASGEKISVSVDATISYDLVRVSDANGCPIFSNFESGAELTLGAGPPVISCNPTAPAPNGTVEFSINGGSSPFTIQWMDDQGSGGSITGEGSGPLMVSGLSRSGVYEVLITDAAGCTGNCTFELEGQDCDLILELIGLAPSCYEPSSGIINTVVVGATGNVVYTWDPAELSGAGNTDLVAGTYSVTATDEAGCQASAQVNLKPDVLDIQIEVIGSLECNADWALRINSIIGGTLPYSYGLGVGSPLTEMEIAPYVIPDLDPGTYDLVIEDATGCQNIVEFTIPQGNSGANLMLDLDDDISVLNGQEAIINPVINFSPASVLWSPAEGVADPNALNTTLSPKRSTVYSLTVTDQFGCAVTDSVSVRVIGEQKYYFPTAFSPNSDGINDLFSLHGGADVAEFRSFRIFNRWGTLMYSVSAASASDFRGWDGNAANGQPAATGIYPYFVQVVYNDGTVTFYSGDVVLIR